MRSRPIFEKSGAAAAIAFGLGELLTLGSLFWGLNFVPDILAGPAVICFLALPFAASWAVSWLSVRLSTELPRR
jgi:hypothetical protein